MAFIFRDKVACTDRSVYQQVPILIFNVSMCIPISTSFEFNREAYLANLHTVKYGCLVFILSLLSEGREARVSNSHFPLRGGRQGFQTPTSL